MAPTYCAKSRRAHREAAHTAAANAQYAPRQALRKSAALACRDRQAEALRISALPICNFTSIVSLHETGARHVWDCAAISDRRSRSVGLEESRSGLFRAD